jgi:Radical SAM superfamily/4Fe-4S single cluster domain
MTEASQSLAVAQDRSQPGTKTHHEMDDATVRDARLREIPNPDALKAAANYFNSVAFLFVPNVCNARCDFCYVAPTFAQTARITPAMLDRAAALFVGLKLAGIQEVRFTGGEPLLFENFTTLAELAQQQGLRYRVLTNGLRLQHHANFLRSCRPERITVSIHDVHRPESYFGVGVDTADILGAIRLLSLHTTIEATIVVRDGAHGNLDATIGALDGAGVTQVKLILSNEPGAGKAMRSFDLLAERAIRRWGGLVNLRTTDTGASACWLRKKGFLSIDLASMEAFSCCVQVGEPDSVVGAHKLRLPMVPRAHLVPAMVSALMLAIEPPGSMPCTTHYGGCPIALRGGGFTE